MAAVQWAVVASGPTHNEEERVDRGVQADVRDGQVFRLKDIHEEHARGARGEERACGSADERHSLAARGAGSGGRGWEGEESAGGVKEKGRGQRGERWWTDDRCDRCKKERRGGGSEEKEI